MCPRNNSGVKLVLPRRCFINRQKFVEAFEEWLYVSDPEALDIILATAVAIYLKGDPLWLLVVGASGGGKTEALNALIGHKKTEMTSTITEKTLMSGFATIPVEEDFISQLNEKVLIVKDLAPLISTKSNEQSVIMADLRDAYDGHLVKRWGAPEGKGKGKKKPLKKEWKGRFGLIAAATPAINQAMIIHAQMGERYTRINYRTDPIEQIERALQNQGKEKEMRRYLKKVGHKFMDYYGELAPKLKTAPLEPELLRQITLLAHSVATLRTPVRLDFKTEEVRYTPVSEVGSRLSKQLLVLMRSSALLNEREVITPQDISLAFRVATDCIPEERIKVLTALLKGHRTTTEVEHFTMTLGRLPNKTAERELKKLEFIGIVQRVEKNWRISTQWQKWLDESGLAEYLINLLPILEEQYALSM